MAEERARAPRSARWLGAERRDERDGGAGAGARGTATSNGVDGVVAGVEMARTASSAAHCTGGVEREGGERSPLAVSERAPARLLSLAALTLGQLLLT